MRFRTLELVEGVQFDRGYLSADFVNDQETASDSRKFVWRRKDMTDEEKDLMEHYGVTAVQETVYLFNGAKYRDLKDALNYAKLLAKRENGSIASKETS